MRILVTALLVVAAYGAELRQEEIKVWNAVGQFGHNVLSQVYKDSENVLISPLSIHTALGMTFLGANGKTKEEMVSALGFPQGITDAEVKSGASELKERLVGHSRNEPYQFRLQMANRLYLSNAYPAKKLYVDTVNQTFGADAVNVDFGTNGAGIKNDINEYVEKKTRGLIKKVLDSELDKDTVIALINTLYFNGTWQTSFRKLTDNVEAFNADCPTLSSPNAKWMQKSQRYPYIDSEDLDAKLVEIPYRSTEKGEASMLVILPNDRNKCKTGEWMNNVSWLRIIDEVKKMTYVSLDFKMPMFDIGAKYQLENVLPLIGMKKAFSIEAEFPEMLQDPKERVKIDQVIHKTKMTVNNYGTEAAAATVVSVVRLAAARPELNPIRVHVTRSFYIALLYRARGDGPALPLFTGVVHKV